MKVCVHFHILQLLQAEKGYKKPHGKKEVKPWGNKRRLRYFISRLGNYFFLRKNAILFNEKI